MTSTSTHTYADNIPRTFHRIWLGPRPMPDDYLEFGQGWLDLHPSWQLVDWGAQDMDAHLRNGTPRWKVKPLPPLRNQAEFDQLVGHPNPSGVPEMPGWQCTAVQQADIAAYELMWRYGGVYLNCDIKPVRDVTPILEGVRAAAVYETEYYVCNCMMVAEKGDRFWDMVIRELPHRMARMGPGRFLNEMTGPWLLTEMHLRHPNMLTVYPREFFNPVGAAGVARGKSAVDYFNPAEHPTAYGVHGWGHRRAGTSATRV